MAEQHGGRHGRRDNGIKGGENFTSNALSASVSFKIPTIKGTEAGLEESLDRALMGREARQPALRHFNREGQVNRMCSGWAGSQFRNKGGKLVKDLGFIEVKYCLRGRRMSHRRPCQQRDDEDGTSHDSHDPASAFAPQPSSQGAPEDGGMKKQKRFA